MDSRLKNLSALSGIREAGTQRYSFASRIRTPSENDISRHREALKARGDEDDGGRIIPVLISTTARARDGHVIEDWLLDHYRKHNPVVLWMHERNALPVGKSPIVDWDKELGELRALAQFASKEVNPMGYRVGEMVAHGYLNQPSVGFDIVDASRERDREVTRIYPDALKIHLAELTEFSVVNVESDTTSGFGRALKRARSEGMQLTEFVPWATEVLDTRAEIGISRETLEDIALNDSHRGRRSSITYKETKMELTKDQIEEIARNVATETFKRCCGEGFFAEAVAAVKPEEEKEERADEATSKTRDPELVDDTNSKLDALIASVGNLLDYVMKENGGEEEGEDAEAAPAESMENSRKDDKPDEDSLDRDFWNQKLRKFL